MHPIKDEAENTEKSLQNFNQYQVNTDYCDFLFIKMSAESPKKAAQAKKTAAKKCPDHLKYINMIVAGITALKERIGS